MIIRQKFRTKICTITKISATTNYATI